MLEFTREQGGPLALSTPAGDRETSVSIPLRHAGHFVGTLAMRAMNVAVGRDASLREYLGLVRGIGAQIEAGLVAAATGAQPGD